MSKKNRNRQSAAPTTTPPGPITYTTALKPHRKLLVVISIIFAVWVGLLLTLYFTTVYPTRHSERSEIRGQKSVERDQRPDE